MTELKNPFEIGRDEKFLHEPAAGDGVFDVIADDGAAVLFGKRMFMHPERVGALGLPIDKAVRRFPDRDLALPAQRDAAEAQAVIEQRPLRDPCVGRRDDFEVQPGRGQALRGYRGRRKTETPDGAAAATRFRLEKLKVFIGGGCQCAALDVVAQHELPRARRQVHLGGEIVDIVFLDVVVNQCDRHNERHQLGAEVADQFHQLAALGSR